MTAIVKKDGDGWGVWTGGESGAFENEVPMTKVAAERLAALINKPLPPERDESAGSVLTGREWD